MSAAAIVEAFRDAFADEPPTLSVINFANADMVGHTGVLDAVRSAVETADACLGEVVATVHAAGGACVITADTVTPSRCSTATRPTPRTPATRSP